MCNMNLEEYPILLDIIHLFRHFAVEPFTTQLRSVHRCGHPCLDCKGDSTGVRQRSRHALLCSATHQTHPRRSEVNISLGHIKSSKEPNAELSIRFSPILADACSVDGTHRQMGRSPIAMVITGLDLMIPPAFEDRLSRIDWAVFTESALSLRYLRDCGCVTFTFGGAGATAADLVGFLRKYGTALQPLIDSTILGMQTYSY